MRWRTYRNSLSRQIGQNDFSCSTRGCAVCEVSLLLSFSAHSAGLRRLPVGICRPSVSLLFFRSTRANRQRAESCVAQSRFTATHADDVQDRRGQARRRPEESEGGFGVTVRSLSFEKTAAFFVLVVMRQEGCVEGWARLVQRVETVGFPVCSLAYFRPLAVVFNVAAKGCSLVSSPIVDCLSNLSTAVTAMVVCHGRAFASGSANPSSLMQTLVLGCTMKRSPLPASFTPAGPLVGRFPCARPCARLLSLLFDVI